MKKLHFAIVFCFVFVACAESPKGEQAEKEKVADTLITPPASNEEKVVEVPERVLEATDNDGNPVTITLRSEDASLDSLGYIKVTQPDAQGKGYLFEAHPWHETVFGPPEDYDGNPLDEADLSMTPWYRITSLSPLAIEFHVTFETVGLTKEHWDYSLYAYYYSHLPFKPYENGHSEDIVAVYVYSESDPHQLIVSNQEAVDNYSTLIQKLETFSSRPTISKQINEIIGVEFKIQKTNEGALYSTSIDSINVSKDAIKFRRNISSLLNSFPRSIK